MSPVSVRPADDADRPDWDAFVAARPEADPLQAWAWGDVRRVSGERPARIVARDDAGRLVGVAQCLVRPAFAGRTVGYVPHGPVWSRDAADAAQMFGALVAGLRELGRRERAIVIKLDPRGTEASGDDLARWLREHGLRQAVHDLQAPRTAVMDLLDGGDALWKTWDPAARNQARRATREGVTVVVDRGGDAASVAAFQALLATAGERGGFRVPSLPQLQAMADAFAATGDWCLSLASFEGTAIAGAAMPRVGDRAFYLYGAASREEAHRRLYGGNAAMAEGMRALAADGARTLDLWGVTDPDDPAADPTWAGFSAFKRQFGGTPVRHPGTFDLVVSPQWDAVRATRERFRDALAARRARSRAG